MNQWMIGFDPWMVGAETVKIEVNVYLTTPLTQFIYRHFKDYFLYTTYGFVTLVMEHWLELEIT